MRSLCGGRECSDVEATAAVYYQSDVTDSLLAEFSHAPIWLNSIKSHCTWLAYIALKAFEPLPKGVIICSEKVPEKQWKEVGRLFAKKIHSRLLSRRAACQADSVLILTDQLMKKGKREKIIQELTARGVKVFLLGLVSELTCEAEWEVSPLRKDPLLQQKASHGPLQEY